MNGRSIFLARLLGLYCLAIGATMLARPASFALSVNALVASGPVLLLAGVATLFAGLAMVLLHNRWRGGPTVVLITLLGWLTLLKAVLLLAMPAARLSAIYLISVPQLLLSGGVTLLLGLWLTVAGFRGRDIASR